MKKIYKLFGIFSLIVIGISTIIYINYDVANLNNIFEDRYSVSVLDDKDEIIGVYLNKDEQWHLKGTENIPEKLKISVLNFEDKNFYSHNGVDFLAIIRSLKNNIIYKKRNGASTITMQVAKISNPKKRSYLNKYVEIIQSFKIENNFSKDEILLMYLNNAPYGGNIVGYKTASHLYFQKKPEELTWAESSLLAVLPNSPSLMNIEKNRDKLIEKRNFLLKKLYEKNYISETQYKLSLREPIPNKRYNFKNLAPHLVRRVIDNNKDIIIHSTINTELQQKLEKTTKDYSEFLKTQGIKNLSVLVVDNNTYEIKGYIGSQDFYDFENNGQVDGVVAKRSPGSVLKPFLYGKAIDEGLIVPQSKVPDIPIYFSNFSPQNANKKYYGIIEIQDALIKSLNTPFVQLLKEYGEDKFFYFLKDVLGFQDNDYSRYGLSLILGTKELSVEDIATLYCGLGNYGNFKSLKYLQNEKKEKGRQLLTSGASYLTLKTIKNLERPGLQNIYKSKYPISWKTGTSYGKRDGWAAGVNPNWTVVVWVGNFTGETNPNLTGVFSAGNLLFDIFKFLPNNQENFKIPEKDLIKIKIDDETGYRLKYDLPYKIVDFPRDAKPLKASPYYKKIFVNDKGEEIDSRNEDFIFRKEKIILNYPIEVINYFIRENIDTSKIFNSKIEKKSIKFIYPNENLKITIPKDFDGEKELIIKIANIKNQKIYWYFDKNYIGLDNSREKRFKVKVGKHQIVIVSENGEIEKVNFEVIKK
ncbi:penicillin-binding protein 1C [Fusobacterium perfoetens]|uniref:penicillin-binding protein 1C n=1 Tax=Fusobacterium perfoetens TaxID=852 RepID=UPI0004808BE3|nr:penicillin-binding protein 1C [Fusobacterium perfoetens]